MNICKNIRLLRRQRKMTQEQLADILGVSYQAVSKWETHANTPDISLLPKIASVFGVSVDALFSDDVTVDPNISTYLKDDGVIRVIQLRGRQVIAVTEQVGVDTPPIEIAFPHDCNDRTQYFKVEVFGHLITDSSINGDVICHQSLQCGSINGDIHADGDIRAGEINSQRITCKNISDCYRLHAAHLDCAGQIDAVKSE